MKKLLVFFIFTLFINNLHAIDNFAVNLAYKKAKSLVQKEEDIAKAFKKYLLEKGSSSSLNTLISESYLVDGFSIINDFGKTISIDVATPSISNEVNTDTKSITKFHDYYYSNTNRTYTLAPVNFTSSKVEIILSKLESYILENEDDIELDQNDSSQQTSNKCLLKEGALTCYDSLSVKKFTYNGKELIIYSIISNLDITNTLIKELVDNGLLKFGNIVYMIDETNDKIVQAVYLDTNVTTQVQVGGSSTANNSNDAKLQITPYSGGYLLNGDVYTWGNNSNYIVTINNKSGVISTAVRARVDDTNYFSSPLRVKFIDFFASSENGTCAISDDYKLYCTNVNNSEFLLTPVAFFDGNTNKANKVVAFDGSWFILSMDGKLYKYNPYVDTIPIDSTKSFKDIKVANEENYKRLYLLGSDGYVYYINSLSTSSSEAIKIESTEKFSSLRSNSRGVIALDSLAKEYYVDNNITKITDNISIYSDAFLEDDNTLKTIWIDGQNKLNGDFNVLNSSDTSSITDISWLKVKFIDKQSICAIDTSYQLYCWGKVGFNGTIIVPLLNSNNFNKFVENSADVGSYVLQEPTYISGFNYDFIFK